MMAMNVLRKSWRKQVVDLIFPDQFAASGLCFKRTLNREQSERDRELAISELQAIVDIIFSILSVTLVHFL